MMGEKFHDLPAGHIGAYDLNEQEIVSRAGDPVKVRGAVYEDVVETNLAAFSGNTKRRGGDEKHDEYGLVMIQRRGPEGAREGAVSIEVRPRDDQNVRQVFYVDNNLCRISVPVELPLVRVTRFYTDGGKFCFNFQDDTGKPDGVVYATQGSADESIWKAVGRVRIDPL